MEFEKKQKRFEHPTKDDDIKNEKKVEKFYDKLFHRNASHVIILFKIILFIN